MGKKSSSTSQNGKGDKPRSCFSNDFKHNYDLIDWGRKDKLPKRGQLREDILKQEDEIEP